MNTPAFATADLCDAHPEGVRVLALAWLDFGARISFAGQITTVKAFEDNSLVREALAETGHGRVLLVDAAGSLARAMLGDVLAAKAVANGWEGVVIVGAIRDSAQIGQLDLGVKALGRCPRRSEKRGDGRRDVGLEVAHIAIEPGHWLYADADGVIVCERALL